MDVACPGPWPGLLPEGGDRSVTPTSSKGNGLFSLYCLENGMEVAGKVWTMN